MTTAPRQRHGSELVEGRKPFELLSHHLGMDPIPNKPDMTSAILGDTELCGGTGTMILDAELCPLPSDEIINLTRAPGAPSCWGVHVWNVERGGNDRKQSTISKTFMWVLFPGNHFLCLYGLEGDGTARGLSLSANLAKPEKPWHPTKIKGGIFFYHPMFIWILLSWSFCCMGIFLLFFFLAFPHFFPAQTDYSEINFRVLVWTREKKPS